MTRPLVDRIRELGTHFPELDGSDMLSRTVKSIVLPQLARAAAKNPEGTEDLIRSFARRFVAALEIPADALFADPPASSSEAVAVDPAGRRPIVGDLKSS